MTVSGTSGTSANSPSLIVNGLISGINTQQVIQALLQAYQQPITNLQNEQSSLNSEASDYQTLVSDMQAVTTAADALNTSTGWNLMSATSSASSVATASAANGAQPGSLSFVVNNLAQANVLLSAGSVASEGSVVTTQSSLLIDTGAGALGFSALGSSTLAIGSHSVQVTQASQAAQVTGTALPTSTTITPGSNDTLDLTVGGSSYSLTLAGGTYSASGLASAINTAAQSANAAITASVNAAGEITLTTAEQGSSATLSVTGGDAQSALGLTATSAQGTDAVVNVDGTVNTVSSVTAGQQITLNGASGSVVATVASSPTASGSLIAAGTADADQVSTGNGTLSAIVQAINGSGLGVTATAIEPTSGQYRLQVSANGTGLAGSVGIDQSVFSSGALVGMNSIASAEDASVTVGGAEGYTLTSATNTFSSLMAGTTVTVAGTGAATVTVAPNASGMASQVASLVSAANQALNDINSLTAYNASTKTGGPLMGSSAVTSLRQQILSIFASATGSSTAGNASAAGITLTSSGTLQFSQSTFEAAYSKNPSQIEDLFTQGGSFSPSSPQYGGAVSLVFANSATQSGAYDVSISQSAAQALDQGAVLGGGTVSQAEQLTVTADGQTASYATSVGESLASIAAGLNDSFNSNGLDLTAAVNAANDQLEITSNGYGSSASFSVTSTNTAAGSTGLATTNNTPADFAGTDVAGTINGVAATGDGQILNAPASDPTLAGLSLLVTTPGVSTSTDLGSFTYSPGLAQQLGTIAHEMTQSGRGVLSSEVSGLQNQATGLNSQIANYQHLETEQQTMLQNEFAKMESTLGSLKNQSSSIAAELSGIAANGA